jgi:CheY-like chemotaxis protein
MSQTSSLDGLQIFVVEDEAMVSTLLEDILRDFGCEVLGVAATVTDALARAAALPRIDIAILDVHLGGETVHPVADLLRARGVPLVFTTGFEPADLCQRYPESRLLNKPYRPEALAKLLGDLRDQAHHDRGERCT